MRSEHVSAVVLTHKVRGVHIEAFSHVCVLNIKRDRRILEDWTQAGAAGDWEGYPARGTCGLTPRSFWPRQTSVAPFAFWALLPFLAIFADLSW